MKRRSLSILLILVMLLSVVAPVVAIENGSYVKEAEKLQLLGVFQGTGNGFELDREPTRLEGLVMLIRLLGKETDAKVLSGKTSVFTDVPTWGQGYANYAYNNGLTKGIGNNLFGSNDKMNAQSYVTFMLRALGYDDSKGDFSYDNALKFAEEIGFLSSKDISELQSKPFLRDHVAKVSMLSLMKNIKGSSKTLLEKLVDEKAISKTIADQINKDVDSKLEVHFIDVGQADSILIKKGNESMLIDAGNNGDSDLIINYLKGQRVEKLNYVIGTHPHEDHIGSLDKVIDRFEVEKVILPNVIHTTKTFEDVLDSIGNKGLSITKAEVGDKYNLGEATFTILAPNQDNYGDFNDYSIVIKFINGNNSFLFTGDAEILSEEEMLKNNKGLLKSDVLKVGHHGSTTSTSQAFLDAVNPNFAIISVGKDNSYGHPNEEIIDRLAKKNIKTYRTDLQGTIVAKSDGKTINFNTQPVKNEVPVTSNVIISNVDKVGELVTIRNNSSVDLQLQGWKIVSVTGNQEFIFPQYTLKANSTVTVASGDVSGDLIWGKGNIWNNSSSDPAILYDSIGNIVSRFE